MRKKAPKNFVQNVEKFVMIKLFWQSFSKKCHRAEKKLRKMSFFQIWGTAFSKKCHFFGKWCHFFAKKPSFPWLFDTKSCSGTGLFRRPENVTFLDFFSKIFQKNPSNAPSTSLKKKWKKWADPRTFRFFGFQPAFSRSKLEQMTFIFIKILIFFATIPPQVAYRTTLEKKKKTKIPE